jgi:hypothetical protein
LLDIILVNVTLQTRVFDINYVLVVVVDGEEVGNIQSKLLCRSILDLYVGEEPFDKHAKEEIELNIASYLKS